MKHGTQSLAISPYVETASKKVSSLARAISRHSSCFKLSPADGSQSPRNEMNEPWESVAARVVTADRLTGRWLRSSRHWPRSRSLGK